MPSSSSGVFDAVDVADGSVLGSFGLGREPDARAAVEAAHGALATWSATSVGARVRVLRAWRGALWRSSSRLAELLHREGGLGFDDAMLDVLRTVEHLKWVEAHAVRALAGTTTTRGPLSPEVAATAWVPEGVVGVVASGRPSVYAASSAVVCALAAGNAVVLQPGPRLTATLVGYAEALDGSRDGAGVLQVLTGDDTTALALAASPVDRLCFLGTPVAGVRVGTAAARAMVPVTVVPVVAPVTLVAPDADLDAAAAAVSRLARGAVDGGAPEVFVAPSALDGFRAALDRAHAEVEPVRRGALARALGRRTTSGPAELTASASAVRVETAPAFEVLVERLRAHPSAQVAVHSARHGAHLAELLTAAEVSVNLPAPSTGGLARAALGARGYGPFAGEPGLRTFARTRTTTTRRRLPVPTAPVEALLATPPGRVATRLALHVRHSLD